MENPESSENLSGTFCRGQEASPYSTTTYCGSRRKRGSRRERGSQLPASGNPACRPAASTREITILLWRFGLRWPQACHLHTGNSRYRFDEKLIRTNRVTLAASKSSPLKTTLRDWMWWFQCYRGKVSFRMADQKTESKLLRI